MPKSAANTEHKNHANLVGLWGFEEGTGTTSTELIQSVVSETIDGLAWAVDGTYEDFLSQNTDTADEIHFATNAAWVGNSAFTLLVLARSDSADITGNPYLVGCDQTIDPFMLYIDPDETLQATLGTSANVTATLTNALSDTDWHVYGFTWDGSEIIARADTSKGSAAAQTGAQSSETTTSTAIFNKRSNTTQAWPGDIAMVAMFDASLSDTDWNAIVNDPMALFDGNGEIVVSPEDHTVRFDVTIQSNNYANGLHFIKNKDEVDEEIGAATATTTANSADIIYSVLYPTGPLVTGDTVHAVYDGTGDLRGLTDVPVIAFTAYLGDNCA